MLSKHKRHKPGRWLAVSAAFLMALSVAGPFATPVYAAGDTGNESTAVQTSYVGFSSVSDVVENNVSVKRWGHYNLMMYGNGGAKTDGATTESHTNILFDTELTLKNNFEREGYQFAGWDASADGTGTDYKNNEKVNVDSFGASDGSDVDLYAQWKANSYKVHYNLNAPKGAEADGSTMADQSFTYDASQRLENCTFGLTKYSFQGWSTEPDGKVVYQNQDVARNLTASADGTVQLYAVWKGPLTVKDAAKAEIEPTSHQHIWQTHFNDTYHWEACTVCGMIKGTGTVKSGDDSERLTESGGKFKITDVTDSDWLAAHKHNKKDRWTRGTADDCHSDNMHIWHCTDGCGWESTPDSVGRKAHGTSWWAIDPVGHSYRCSVCGESWLPETINGRPYKGHYYHEDADGNQIGADTGHKGTCVYCGAVFDKDYQVDELHDEGLRALFAKGTGKAHVDVDTAASHMGVSTNGLYYNTAENIEKSLKAINPDAAYMRQESGYCLNDGFQVFDLDKSYGTITYNDDGTISFDVHIYIVPTDGKRPILYGEKHPEDYVHYYYGDQGTVLSSNVEYTEGSHDYHATGTVKQNYYGSASLMLGILSQDGKYWVNTEDHAHWLSYICIMFSPDGKDPVIDSFIKTDLASRNGWTTNMQLSLSGTEDYSNNVTVSITDEKGNKVADDAVVPVTDKKWSYIVHPQASSGTLTATVTDDFGNQSKKTLKIDNVDTAGPVYTGSKTDFTGEWNKTVTIDAAFDDGNGSGVASIGLDDSDDLEAVTDGKRMYIFTGDRYEESENLLIAEDKAGNKGYRTLNIGRIDNTAPYITNVAEDGLDVTVKASDVNTVLGKSGSGVTWYGYMNPSKDSDFTWVKSAGTSCKLSLPKSGEYVLAVKDLVGNVSETRPISVRGTAKAKQSVFSTNFDEE